MSIHRYVAIECDACGFVGPELHSLKEADTYVLTGPDGKWTTTDERLICRGCITDRACRIFGHTFGEWLPTNEFGTRWCSRCHHGDFARDLPLNKRPRFVTTVVLP